MADRTLDHSESTGQTPSSLAGPGRRGTGGAVGSLCLQSSTGDFHVMQLGVPGLTVHRVRLTVIMLLL